MLDDRVFAVTGLFQIPKTLTDMPKYVLYTEY
jgi:hypothetical protein